MSSLVSVTKTTTIGIKEMKTITLYPLSVADQLKLPQIAADFMQRIAGREDLLNITDMAFVELVTEFIQEKIHIILAFVTEAEVSLEELTNLQLMEIVNAIFDMNFEPVLKNWNSLSERVRIAFQLERPSPSSLSGILDTELKMSPDFIPGKEDLPSDK